MPFSALGDEPDAAIGEWFTPADHPEWPGHWAVLPEPWPEDRLLGREVRERLDRAIDALPVSQRAVITLRDIEGLGSAEVCNVLELTSTVP